MNRQPRVVSWSSRAPRSQAASALAITYGARVIDSTPPAMNTSPSSAPIACAAALIAWRPEPHSRFTVWPATSTGRPASRSAIRATLRLSSPAWLAQPRITSSTRAGSIPVRSTSALIAIDARSSGRTAGERAAIATDRRADRADDPRLAHGSPRITSHRPNCTGGAAPNRGTGPGYGSFWKVSVRTASGIAPSPPPLTV